MQDPLWEKDLGPNSSPHQEKQDELLMAAENVRAGFRLADDNGDGVISQNELKSVLRRLGMSWTDDQFEILFREADVSQDGVLQYDEFVDYIFGVTKDPKGPGTVSQALFPASTLHQALLEFRHIVSQAGVERRNRSVRVVAEAVALLSRPSLGTKKTLPWYRVVRFFLSSTCSVEVLGANGGQLPDRIWRLLQDKYLASKEWQSHNIKRNSRVAGVLALWVEYQAMQPREDSDSEDDAPGQLSRRLEQSLEKHRAQSDSGEESESAASARNRVEASNRRVRSSSASPPSRQGSKMHRSVSPLVSPMSISAFAASTTRLGEGSTSPVDVQGVGEDPNLPGLIPRSRSSSKGSTGQVGGGGVGAVQAAVEALQQSQKSVITPSPRSLQSKPKPRAKAKQRAPAASKLEFDNVARRDRLRKEFPFQGYIEKTELRGITFKQLRRVKHYVARHCMKWIDGFTRDAQGEVQHLTIETANLYHVNQWVIMPATKEKNCAFVELLTSKAQDPRWFCSHWWGEAIHNFLRCIERHVDIRGLSGEDPYWICAYANRQHSIASEIHDDPCESSFYRAMLMSEGVLLILDPKRQDTGTGPATPFSRIWCNFEESKAVDDSLEFLFDIATCTNARAVILSEGVTVADELNAQRSNTAGMLPTRQKTLREQCFPIDIIEEGLRVCVQDGFASNEMDRVHILNSICELPLNTMPPPTSHPNYDRVNAKLRAVFAAAAWRNAQQKSKVAALGLPKVISDNKWLDVLLIDLSDMAQVTDCWDIGRALDGLADLHTLTVNVSNCENLSCVEGLAAGLQSYLESLKTVTVHIDNVDNILSLRALFQGFRRLPVLQRLTVTANKCQGLLDIGADELNDHPTLRNLKLELAYCVNLTDISCFGKGFSLPSLSIFDLNLVGCRSLGWKYQRMYHSLEALLEVNY